MKKGKSFIVVIILIIIIVVGVKFKNINDKYPKAKEEEYTLGDMVSYRGIELIVKDVKIIENDEILKMNLRESEFYKNDKRKAIVATVNFKNNSNEVKSIESDYFEAATIDWHNGLNYEIFSVLNGSDKSAYIELKPKEEITLQLPYEMFDFQFKSKIWNNTDELHFKLVLDIYPTKKVVNLD